MTRINVTKTFLPPIEEYEAYLEKIWSDGQLTNQGPLLQEFENKTKAYLGTENFHFVSNGTIALQLALRALNITDGEIITTPFSYVATASSIIWERCTPVFVDIDSDTLCIDPAIIEQAITPHTRAIMPVHVFGIACDIEAIENIAKKHNLRTIYDGAHAFGAKYKQKALLSYGDISTCSFHATKLIHTIEGGGIITKDEGVSDKVELIKRFGHNYDDHVTLGINAKATEFQAAMGLANLKYLDENIAKRRQISELYDSLLGSIVRQPNYGETERNYAYYPVIFENESQLNLVTESLNKRDIYPRRYFFPSLNTLPYLEGYVECPVSEDIATRILCLPLYPDIGDDVVREVSRVIEGCLA